MKPDPVRFVITLEAVRDPLTRTHGERFAREPAYRLRLLLKGALRSLGLKCTNIRTEPTPVAPETPTCPN